ncbi:hypothetical protein Msil_2859 [Methylocella silvestris BL2]|uniref:Uncharacterized protein n=1 Tax=Methylocella silvestris (strain DSM 15510 / CIP 108128 / LMG 27833 / NCIMB 13906 / BL2) TaxID=395965 RepID=B8ETD4_METSB|nr:hypothetical protein [Methylocella silvestris]ACK51776.1 hypothetical protein Msil_2859 [Methylocella silvestris BL2]
MRIQSEGQPHAGEDFHFSVSGGAGAKTLKAYIEYKTVLDISFSGDLQQTLAIPSQTGKFTLKLLAHDGAGESAEMRYVIAGEPPAP